MPIFTAEESSLSLFYSTLKFRVTCYIIYRTLTFLSVNRALAQLQKHPQPIIISSDKPMYQSGKPEI